MKTQEEIKKLREQNRKKIEQALQDVLPHGSKVPQELMDNLPQVIGEIMDVLHEAMRGEYPNHVDSIDEAYIHVKADINNQLPYIY